MRKIKGCTLVELLVVVVIIGILAAIALPNFIGSQQKARAAAAKGNMRTAQTAAAAYATDSGGAYPPTGAAAVPYFPGGDKTIGATSPATHYVNPMSGANMGAPAAGGVANVITRRATAASAQAVAAGTVRFDTIDARQSYAVMGGDANGEALSGAGGNCLDQ